MSATRSHAVPARNSPPARPRSAAVRGGFLTATSLAALARIDESHVSAVLVRRKLAPELKALAEMLPELGFCRMVPLGDGFAARALLGRSFPQRVAAALADDIERLTSVLAGPLGGRGHAQLAVTAGDECRKFHVDYYRLRLLVSYVGPGTELVPEFALNRRALCTGGDDVEQANCAIARDPNAVVRARCGDIVLVKGVRYGSGLAAVHRSPTISSAGLTRLILKVTIE